MNDDVVYSKSGPVPTGGVMKVRTIRSDHINQVSDVRQMSNRLSMIHKYCQIKVQLK